MRWRRVLIFWVCHRRGNSWALWREISWWSIWMRCCFPSPCTDHNFLMGPRGMFWSPWRKCQSLRVTRAFLNCPPPPCRSKYGCRRKVFLLHGVSIVIYVNVPDTVEHVFSGCWGAVLFWDVLKRTFKKYIFINSHSIRFLPTHKNREVPYNMIMPISLYSIWKSRMDVRHAAPSSKRVHVHFIQSISQVEAVLETGAVVPESGSVFDKMLSSDVRWM